MTNLSDFVIQVRRDILRMVHAVNSGHPGGSLGCAEFMVVLYQKIMKRNKDFTMDGENEDLFFSFERSYFSCILQRTSSIRIFSNFGTSNFQENKLKITRSSHNS